MGEIVVKNINEIETMHQNQHERYEFFRHAVSGTGAAYREGEDGKMVVAFYTIPPGKSNFPYHYHTANEEVFYIISGSGVLETPQGDREIGAGDVVICPTGANGAHKITNSSATENLVYLDVDTNILPEIAIYPHTNKVGLRADGVREILDLGGKMDYYCGEEEQMKNEN